MTSARDEYGILTDFKGLLLGKNQQMVLEPNRLTKAENVDITEEGIIEKRKGWVSFPTLSLTYNAGNRYVGSCQTEDTYCAVLYVASDSKLKVLDNPEGGIINSVVVASPYDCSVIYNDIMYIISSYTDDMYTFTEAAGFTLQANKKAGTHAVMHKDRLFLINNNPDTAAGTPEQNRVWFSDIGDPLTFQGTSFFDVLKGNDDFLVALVSYNDNLYIFKSRSTWVIDTEGEPADWVLRNINSSLGCCSKYGIQEVNEILYVVNDRGLFTFDGINFNSLVPEEFSFNLDIFIPYETAGGAEIWGDLNKIYLGHFKEKMLITVEDDTEAYAFNLSSRQWTKYIFSYQSEIPLFFFEPHAPAANVWEADTYAYTKKYFVKEQIDAFYDADDSIVGNDGYPVVIQFAPFDGGEPFKYKRLKNSFMEYSISPGVYPSTPGDVDIVIDWQDLVQSGTNILTLTETVNPGDDINFKVRKLGLHGYFAKGRFSISAESKYNDFKLKSLITTFSRKRPVTNVA